MRLTGVHVVFVMFTATMVSIVTIVAIFAIPVLMREEAEWQRDGQCQQEGGRFSLSWQTFLGGRLADAWTGCRRRQRATLREQLGEESTKVIWKQRPVDVAIRTTGQCA
jgi:hypothetical protein